MTTPSRSTGSGPGGPARPGDAADLAAGRRRQARPPRDGAQPGHVRRRGRRGAVDGARGRQHPTPLRVVGRRCGCGSPSSSPTSPRRWPRAGARPRRPRCGGPRPRPWRAGCCADGTEEAVPGPQLRLGDRVVVEAGEVIPGDGDVVEGVASVDESAITGESAPVIRESGGDRSSVTGGTKVLSDRIVVQITARPGESFIDRMIALVEGASRQKTPNEIALNILLASLTIVFLHGHRDAAALRHLLGRRAVADRARRAAGVPDPDHDRGAAVGDRHRRDGPARAAQRAGHVRPGGRGGRRRQHAAAGQDRHHHPRQPAGRRVHRRSRGVDDGELADAAQLSSLADETPEGRSIVVLAKTAHGLRERAPGELAPPTSSRSPPRPG